MKKMFRKAKAFTLAEILIALTVIGIVSALTIPNLSRNMQAAHSKTAFKKTLAEINTAIADFKANEGKNLAEVTDNNELLQLFTNYMGAKAITNEWNVVHNMTYVGANMSTNSEVNLSYASSISNEHVTGTYYLLPSGVAIMVPTDIISCGKPRLYSESAGFTNNANKACLIYIDVNGRKGPNQQLMGVDSTDATDDACVRIVDPETNDFMLKNTTEGQNAKKYCQLTDDAVTDVYPVVLFNDKAYPATVAGYWVMNDLIGQEITPPTN